MTLFAKSLISVVLTALSIAAAADEPAKIRIGFNATTDSASVFVAQEEGIFRKHDIAADLTLLAQGNAAIAAAASGSLDIVGCTPPAFLQAVESGIDLVGVAGGSLMSKEVNDFTALVARNGSNIHGAKDLEGKRVGVPALNGTLYTLFLVWLEQNGVDWHKVNLVEIPFPVQPDALKSGAIDAAIPIDPMLSRILNEGTSYRVASYMETAPEGLSAVLYCAERGWATKHIDTVHAFQASLREGVGFMRDHAGSQSAPVRADIAKYVKMPPEIMAKMIISHPEAELKIDHLQWWYDTLRKQGGLEGKLDLTTLIVQ